MTSRNLLAAAASAAVVISLVACQGANPAGGSSSPAPSGSAAPATGGGAAAMDVTVEMKGFKFVPADVTVKKGGKITWKNMDTAKHNAEPVSGSAFAATALIGQNETVSATFNTVGKIEYQCNPHKANMKGTITVVE